MFLKLPKKQLHQQNSRIKYFVIKYLRLRAFSHCPVENKLLPITARYNARFLCHRAILLFCFYYIILLPLDYTRNRHDGVEQERDTGWWSANIHFQPDDEDRTAKTLWGYPNADFVPQISIYFKIDRSSSSSIDKEEDWRRGIYLFFFFFLHESGIIEIDKLKAKVSQFDFIYSKLSYIVDLSLDNSNSCLHQYRTIHWTGTITWFLDKSYRSHRPDVCRVRFLSNTPRSRFLFSANHPAGKKSQQSNVIVVAEDTWRQLNIILQPNNSTGCELVLTMSKYLCGLICVCQRCRKNFTIVDVEEQRNLNDEWSMNSMARDTIA